MVIEKLPKNPIRNNTTQNIKYLVKFKFMSNITTPLPVHLFTISQSFPGNNGDN